MANGLAIALGALSGLLQGIDYAAQRRRQEQQGALALFAQQPGARVSPVTNPQAAPFLQRLLGSKYQSGAGGAPVVDFGGVPVTVTQGQSPLLGTQLPQLLQRLNTPGQETPEGQAALGRTASPLQPEPVNAPTPGQEVTRLTESPSLQAALTPDAQTATQTQRAAGPSLRARAYMPTLTALAQEYGVDPALVTAVVQSESSGNPHAVSRKGAQGLMQLMPQTAQVYGVTDPFDVKQNLRGGIQFLADLQKKYPGRLDLQLAAYNAGEPAVDAYGGVPPYPETQAYVQNILGQYQPDQEAQPRTRAARSSSAATPTAETQPAALPSLPERPKRRAFTPEERQIQKALRQTGIVVSDPEVFSDPVFQAALQEETRTPGTYSRVDLAKIVSDIETTNRQDRENAYKLARQEALDARREIKDAQARMDTERRFAIQEEKYLNLLEQQARVAERQDKTAQRSIQAQIDTNRRHAESLLTGVKEKALLKVQEAQDNGALAEDESMRRQEAILAASTPGAVFEAQKGLPLGESERRLRESQEQGKAAAAYQTISPAIATDLALYNTVLRGVEAIDQLYDPNFVGKVNTGLGKVYEFLGVPEKDSVEFDRLIKDLSATYRRIQTGLAGPIREMEELKSAFVRRRQEPAVFREALRGAAARFLTARNELAKAATTPRGEIDKLTEFTPSILADKPTETPSPDLQQVLDSIGVK